ncbi:glycosyltransferase family 2 protein [Patescibacteria group bacterium]|nr:glycosyltransferase family 2 protein [Patescibacteria group bacterium]MBU1563738.1 glycosyltransferase family 2 protein [Patescibacteria group bacterium]
MEKVFLSVIIPAYNEEMNISNTLLDIDHYLSQQDYTYEILVVIDGAKDKTAQIVGKFVDLVKNLRVINNKENHGKGWVVRQGMLEAKGQIRLFMDADNATTIDHFKKMIPLFEQGYQVVIGSRDSKDVAGAKQAVPQPFHKRLVGNMGNLVIQLVAVSGIWDTQCGFKALTAQVAEDVFSRCRIDRWSFDVEVLAIARMLGCKIGIIPVYWINNPNSRVSWKSYFKTFWEVFKIRWNLITKKYDQR